MQDFDSNNSFLSYYGTISRKNYAINMLILIALFAVISFVRFENFEQFITFKIVYQALIFVVSFFKFIIIMSAISLIYRRLADIAHAKSSKFQLTTRRIFIVFFFLPFLYVLCIRLFIDSFHIITSILDLIVLLIILPLGIITSIVISFIKGN